MMASRLIKPFGRLQLSFRPLMYLASPDSFWHRQRQQSGSTRPQPNYPTIEQFLFPGQTGVRDRRCLPLIVRAESSQAPSPSSNGRGGQLLTLPTLLTLGRVVAIPLVIAAWYWPSPHANSLCVSIFLAACATDWLDGYLARKMRLSSAFGAFLDPVADKLMVAALLVLLSTSPLGAGPLAGNTLLVPLCAVAIISRELVMSALREWAATLGGEARSAVAVSSAGKWKTACQMTALALLLWSRDASCGAALPFADVAATSGAGLLLLATWLTLRSLLAYARALWRFMV